MAEPTVVTDRAAFRAAARDAEPGARVPVEVRLAVADPFDAYRRARGGTGGPNVGDEHSETNAGDERAETDAGTETDAGAAAGDGAFLETTGGQDGWGYFGVDPVDRFTVGPDAAVWRVVDTAAQPDSAESADGQDLGSDDGTAAGRAPTAADSPTLAALGGWLGAEALARGDCDVPYPCGAVGWLSYDVARELESLPGGAADDRELPRCQFAAFDRLAAWECPASEPVELRITACPRVGGRGDLDDCTDVDAAYERGLDRALDLVERIRTGRPDVAASDDPASSAETRADDDGAATRTADDDADAGDDGAATQTADDDADAGDDGAATRTDGAATFESDCGRAAFADRVERIQDAIRAGETFQANVSHRLTAPAAIHPVAAYDALREVNPAPYSALLELPAADLVSASPELLLERAPPSGRGAGSDRDSDRDRLRTEPIAGTRPRGATEEVDRDLEAELRGDEKERAEHGMLVDLERNDLGKVCAYGSVDVTEYRRVDRYAEVMHLVSLVEGDLRADASLVDAIAALFPGGTITGAPKPRTMQLIDEVEATRRGPYTGSIGMFGFDGRVTLNIVIRTLVRCADEYHLRVGAGIVHDSEPEREYAETLDKARALVTAVDRALGERADLAVERADDLAVERADDLPTERGGDQP